MRNKERNKTIFVVVVALPSIIDPVALHLLTDDTNHKQNFEKNLKLFKKIGLLRKKKPQTLQDPIFKK